MNKHKSLINKWNNISFEKNIIIGWIFTFLVVISISAIIYFSKKEVLQSMDMVALNAELSSATQDLYSTILKLEVTSKRFRLTNSKQDSVKYFITLDSLKINMAVLERLIKHQPRLDKYFVPLQRTIREELYKINHLSFLTENTRRFNSQIIIIEEDIYKRVGMYSQLLDAEEDQITAEQVQSIQSKINKNLNYFIVLVLVYVVVLSVLFAIILSYIKKRRKISQELFESRNSLKAIIDTAASLIFVKNSDRDFTLVNKSFLDYFNLDNLSSFPSRNSSKIFHEKELRESKEEDELVIKDRKILKNIERMMIRNNKENRWLSVNKAPLIGADDEVIGLVGVMDDITNRKMYEAELSQAKEKLTELNAHKDKFFSIIAHDLRSPFTALLGLSQFLVDDYNELSEDEKKEDIKNINVTVKSLLELINNLLTWSRLQFNKADDNPEQIKMFEIINSVFNSLRISALDKKINLETICSDNLTAIVDKNMIETVIRNLVSNSIKFTKENGTIKVRVTDDSGNITVAIEDNGVGMSEDIANKLFKLNSNVIRKGTADEKGTGLGLLICKEFVEQHNGKIWVESEEGKGSTFYFTIPLNNNNEMKKGN
jgi:PAS domain S-box-containing protein